MKLRPGGHFQFSYRGKEMTGVLIQEVKGRLTIKLNSGYNISVKQGELKQLKALKVEKKEVRQHRQRSDPKLPKISLLHTGGTIASKIDYDTGAVIAKFSNEEILELFPELNRITQITSRLIGNMQSEMMRFAHWNLLAKAVAEEVKKGVKGVIITQGTDILHMTSAALAFALENCPIPVLLVGSQRSSDRPSSDAISNLLCAAAFIANSQFTGVGICMHESNEHDTCVVLPACKTRKMHSTRRDAFKPINDSPYARISYPKLEVKGLKAYPKTEGKFSVKPYKETLKIGILHVHPQLFVEEITTYRKFDGLILELLGLGHAPTMVTDAHNKENKKILEEITTIAKKIPVAGAPQTIYGRVNMNVYSPGRQLLDAGLLGQNLDMTPETAFVKLAWLLSNYSKKETRELYAQNLRGEISERTEEREFE